MSKPIRSRTIWTRDDLQETDLAVWGNLFYDPPAMNCRKILLAAGHLVLWSVASVNQAEEPDLLPRAGVLVLRNGSVLRGDILRVGDRYVVGLNERDEVSVSTDRVDLRCRSLKEAYRRKQHRLSPDAAAEERLRLADWCLRQDLLAAAAEQLMAAQRLAPDQSANEHFEKRLRLAARQRSRRGKHSAPAHYSPPADRLDKIAEGLPAGMVELFTTNIQPLLVNHCGSGACHGPKADSKFRLMLPTRNSNMPRRFTQNNLETTLRFVDPEDPGQSDLLSKATEAHGGTREPALTDGDVEQLRHLAEWVYGSRQKPAARKPEAIKDSDKVVSRSVKGQDRQVATSQSEAANDSRPTPDATLDAGRSTEVRADRQVQPAHHLEASSDETTSQPDPGADPFDPEIFNRRYLK